MESFIKTQFGYCPLTWKVFRRNNYARINNVHGEH